MQIICVSRGSYVRGKEVAEKLADKLGYPCVGREELVDAAADSGIATGKLEMSVIKPHLLDERVGLEKEHYHAFVTAALCERALASSIVYHGRSGHLLLPGVAHLMRVRVIADMEYRIHSVMQRLRMDRGKARAYIEQIEEDHKKYVKVFHGADWGSAAIYDATINVAHMSVDNSATLLCHMAQLPDFQATPASIRAVEDLLLASRCRIALAHDERTWQMNVQIKADRGVASVKFLPHQSRLAAAIPEVCGRVEGVREVVATMATTNLLWVQEEFDSGTEVFRNVVEVAERWNAAVELLRLAPQSEAVQEQDEAMILEREDRESTGGIEEDVEEWQEEPGGIVATQKKLIEAGRAGGARTVRGGEEKILQVLDRPSQYSLVVVGRVYSEKGPAAQKRLSRELASFLSDNIKAPVVQAEELAAQYLFGPKSLLKLLFFAAVAALVVFLVFTNQEPIQSFLYRYGAESWTHQALAVIAVVIFIPIFALIYGSVGQYLLKLFKFE